MLRTLLKRKTEYCSRGFTITETLVAVAILTVLMALAVPNLLNLRKTLRQTELDAKAETIYIAAQNQLVRLRTGGNARIYEDSTNALPESPSDAIGIDENGEEIVRALYFAYPGETVGDAIMTADTIDNAVLEKYWIIEYDKANGNVYAVYYSEERNIVSDYLRSWEQYDLLRDRDARIDDGSVVGYYGGDIVSSSSGTSQLSPIINVNNGETLKVYLQCTAPRGTDELVFTLTIRDDYGHRCKRVYSSTTSPQLRQRGRSFDLTLTLDDLSSPGMRFNALYGSESGNPIEEQLVPGSPLTLTLTVGSKSGLIETSAPVSASTNGLFGDDSSSGTAQILCGRHLQNLDESSGVTSDITAAEQHQDIYFAPIGTKTTVEWLDIYGDAYFNGMQDGKPKFQPIVNSALRSYDGGDKRIARLNIGDDGDVALFEAIDGGVTLERIRLTGATVRGENAAALVGSVTGAGNVISGCHVYLEPNTVAKSDDIDKVPKLIDGTLHAGGLVGVVESGSLTITNSFASTVVSANGVAGGLVGRVKSGTLDVDTSYADCYLFANATGGLVGSGNVNSLINCYAAGFQKANTAAGLAYGRIDEAENCYTICAMTATNTYRTAVQIPSHRQVYFFSSDNQATHNDGAAALNTEAINSLAAESAFHLDELAPTVAYNLLRSQALQRYPYPRLVAFDNRHYGDWQADFQGGSLVYYEEYKNSSRTYYGFFGAGLSTLTDKDVVVGDGYGVVFKMGGDMPENPIDISIDNGKFATTLSKIIVVTNENGADTGYRIFPLPNNNQKYNEKIVNAAPENGSFYHTVTIGTSSFLFNPHFANTAFPGETSEGVMPTEGIVIRTPRHLYNLSANYDSRYRKLSTEIGYYQERDIIFSQYKWTDYTVSDTAINRLQPIGKSEFSPFGATYDGGYHTISDVSFISATDNYIGMFGYNKGTLQNIVLATEYKPERVDHYFVQRTGAMEANKPVSMGVLAGYNATGGTITNCAVAGYYLAGSDGTLHVYENCTLYAGGLVGRNNGTIRNSAADCPTMRLSSLFATINAGGLVGRNGGTIENCYALGHAEVVDTRGEGVTISGFAGVNEGTGRIQNSYCAFSLSASGTTRAYGFTPKGGLVTNCYYLDNGTYSYAGALHTYSSEPQNTYGTSNTHKQLSAKRGAATASGANCLYHPNSGTTGIESYPFRAVVRDRNDNYIHYGDWQLAPNLGTLGVFYWEHEENGANSGYHLTYLGTDEGASQCGTTLCTAHDDGGVITEFGYGYYVQNGQQSDVTLTADGIARGTVCNAAAQKALQQQISGYVFYPYTTRIANTGDYLYLNNEEKTTGTWTLNFQGNSYTYILSPFFANAISRDGATVKIGITSSAGIESDHSKTPGSTENSFEVRSAQQLQYINWNYAAKNCTTLMAINTHQQFPFLQYATVTDTTRAQPRSEVEACRPPQTWTQTHDVSGKGVYDYTPIAGMATSSPWSNGVYTNILYGWFGGSYDGQSYKIVNLNVISPAYSVGLFGVTLGANIKNIIMYSDSGCVVERRTAGETAKRVGDATMDFEARAGAYNLGGLIGIAYEYKSNTVDGIVSNCAIAGYTVRDSSTNQQGAGTANVGGLIGLANVNLNRCSAITDINIASTHENGHMAWGSYIRVGGLAGSAGAPQTDKSKPIVVEVRDCYTGGSVTIADVTQNEMPGRFDGDHFAIRDAGSVGYTVNIFVSGMIGGSYAPNMSNITTLTTNKPDGTAKIVNCYTFLKLPNLEGNVRAVSLFANQGDRYGMATSISTENCYYLENIANVRHPDRDDPTTWPKFFFVTSKSATGVSTAPSDAEWAVLRGEPSAARDALVAKYQKLVISEDEFQNMLNGNLVCLAKYLNPNGDTTKPDTFGVLPLATPVTFEELSDQIENDMAARLGSAWSWVTVIEGSDDMLAQIDGKYSFSNNPSQEGKNYPFPAVVTQPDVVFGGEVYVHYGEWFSTGYEWETARNTMDIFADMDMANLGSAEGPYAEKTFYLSYEKAGEAMSETLAFDSDAERWRVVRYTHEPAKKRFAVTIRALKPGTAVITEKTSGAALSLNITADLTISTLEPDWTLHQGSEQTFNFTVRSTEKESNSFTVAPKGAWVFESEDDTLLELSEATTNAGLPSIAVGVTGHDVGLHGFTATYTYDYHGTPLSETLFVQTRTLGNYIGLSNGNVYRSVKRSTTSAPSTESGTYSGTPQRPEQAADLFLFASATDDDLGEFSVDRVTVSGDGVSNGDYSVSFFTKESDGSPDIKSESGSDSGDDDSDKFAYRGASVRYLGAGESPAITVTVELTDPNGVGKYSLSVPMTSVPNGDVYFDNNGGDGTMRKCGSVNGSFTAPDCAFTRTGYSFSHWLYGEQEIQPGDDLTELPGVAMLYAQWEPNTYTVRFNPNGGDGTMEDVNMVYDVATQLPSAAFTRVGSSFAGWQAEIDGVVRYFSNGATIKNLSTGAQVTLYARWSTQSLTLVANGELTSHTPQTGEATLTDYEQPSRDGWTLAGWYTNSSPSGVKVLNANGSVAANVAGYTADGGFAVSGDSILYAKWVRDAYVQIETLNEGMDDTYLIANGDSGTVKLLANDSTANNNASFSSVTATVTVEAAYDEDGNAIGSYILLADTTENAKAKWTLVSPTDVKSSFDYPRYMLKNCKGLSIRDDGGGLKVRNSANWMWNGDYSNRNLWSFNTAESGRLESQYAHAESKSHKSLGWSGSAWTVGNGYRSYLFRAEEIATFG